MAYKSELIKLKDFRKLPAKSTHGTGVRITLNLPKAILGLRHEVGTLATQKDGIEKFHIQERGLYTPLEKVLLALLPKGAVLDQEAVLKKLANPRLKTDLSIRKLECHEAECLDDHGFAAIIEMKSVFHGEKLTEADLLRDIEKLLECEAAYAAKCFFVLIGLKGDIAREAKSLSRFLLNNQIGPISIALPSKKTAWLKPSARHVVDSPYVYVWTVSNHPTFGSHASDYVYTVFQSV